MCYKTYIYWKNDYGNGVERCTPAAVLEPAVSGCGLPGQVLALVAPRGVERTCDAGEVVVVSNQQPDLRPVGDAQPGETITQLPVLDLKIDHQLLLNLVSLCAIGMLPDGLGR
eukprot:SAG31_NODE_11663_length_1008_cov_1.630363_1_plen_112_part_10